MSREVQTDAAITGRLHILTRRAARNRIGKMAKAKSVSDTHPPMTVSEAHGRNFGSGTIAVSTENEMIDPELSTEPGSGEGSPGSDHQEDQQSGDDSTGPGSVKTEQVDDNDTDFHQTMQMPVQKRRRVTRACDECRRKKIKCDGKQPCTHCSVYSYGEARSHSKGNMCC